ncbi:MAG TPA: 30S ribosomal protein S20 [Coxiellaceae bacterium]|nr:30S ribosomal protein S20 [Coxiellaceae bacterium]
MPAKKQSQAKKRIKQAQKHALHNASLRTRVRSAVKKAVKTIETGKKEERAVHAKEAISMVDKTVSKGLFHKNKAARLKSRLNKKLKAKA